MCLHVMNGLQLIEQLDAQSRTCPQCMAGSNQLHARHVRELSIQLFDQLQPFITCRHIRECCGGQRAAT